MPPAPPEADVIKVARMAAKLSPDEAAARLRDAGGKISASYWRDIERGHGGRRGLRVTTRASEGLLAQMAQVVGVTPAQLTAAGREDAARVLQAILARQDAPHRAPEDRPFVLQGIDPAELVPYIEQVDQDIAEFRPWRDKTEADTWRDPDLSLDRKRSLIALYRWMNDGGMPGQSRSRSRSGLAARAGPLYHEGVTMR